jgi:hypothetical protein
MDSVGLFARRGLGRPINALVRRLRGRIDAFAKRPDRTGIGGAQPVETLVTTTPSPPPFVHSWLRHLDILRSAPQGASTSCLSETRTSSIGHHTFGGL